jgi:hypothetical protein
VEKESKNTKRRLGEEKAEVHTSAALMGDT